MLELINAARANPAAEAARLGIGLNDGLSPGTLSNFTRQPLASHPALLSSARLHGAWMDASDTFSHSGSGGSDPGQRMEAAGYLFTGDSTWAENLSLNGEAATSHDALFKSPGHRVSMLNDLLEEVGVGHVFGDYEGQERLFTTVDFGRSASTPGPIVTGVVYFDIDNDGRYDAGEGIGGVQVGSPGTTWTAVTGTAGGYALPVPADGNYTLQFSAPNLSYPAVPVLVSGGRNRKLDIVPPYAPPIPTGPNALGEGASGDYGFLAVPAASSHDVAFARYVEGAFFDGAESGYGGVLPEISPGYALIQSGVRASGSFAFHLTHPVAADQVLELAKRFRPGPSGNLTFRKRLGWASPGQVARAEISADHGRSWIPVWTQAGTGGVGNSGFSQVTVDLAPWSEQELRVRFVYAYEGGAYYPQDTDGVGFYLDDLSVQGCQVQVEEEIVPLGAAAGFQFAPDQGGLWLLRVRGVLPGRVLPWGPGVPVSVAGEGVVPPDSTVLGAPNWLGAKRAKSGDRLRWELVSGAAEYRVERKMPGSSTWKFVGVTTSTSYYAKFPNKSAKDKKLRYRLQAVASDGTVSSYSAVRTVRP